MTQAPETRPADEGIDTPFSDLDDDGDSARPRARKAPNAFRTISEVADDLHIPQHVLRFWETKFPQVKPLKRGGGRRYYRPDDIALLRRISDLLYTQGYTIKGVQRLLREGGGRLSDDIPPPSADEIAEALDERREAERAPPPDEQLPMPGLASAPPPRPRAEPAPAANSAVDSLGREVQRLREVLSATLQELQTLRAMLP
ncbi:MAG TPA: MerR family transcriptional regulator [Acetobacteraceae bacterium]